MSTEKTPTPGAGGEELDAPCPELLLPAPGRAAGATGSPPTAGSDPEGALGENGESPREGEGKQDGKEAPEEAEVPRAQRFRGKSML